MANIKYVRIPKKKIEGAILAGKLFTKSEKPMMSIVQQFNSLPSKIRNEIIQEWDRRENIIKEKIKAYPKNEELYISLIGIELHKVAALYDTQPDTVALCISKLCSSNHRILVK